MDIIHILQICRHKKKVYTNTLKKQIAQIITDKMVHEK